MPRPSYPTPPTYDPGPGTISSPTPNDSPEVLPSVLPSVHPIVSRWQRLASMDRQSSDFLPLLLSLTTGANRSSTTALRDDDAKITLSTLDQVSHPFFGRENGQVVTYIMPPASFLGTEKSRINAIMAPSM